MDDQALRASFHNGLRASGRRPGRRGSRWDSFQSPWSETGDRLQRDSDALAPEPGSLIQGILHR